MFEGMFKNNEVKKVESSKVVELKAPGVIVHPGTGEVLGSASTPEQAADMIRQASEDRREAA